MNTWVAKTRNCQLKGRWSKEFCKKYKCSYYTTVNVWYSLYTSHFMDFSCLFLQCVYETELYSETSNQRKQKIDNCIAKDIKCENVDTDIHIKNWIKKLSPWWPWYLSVIINNIDLKFISLVLLTCHVNWSGSTNTFCYCLPVIELSIHFEVSQHDGVQKEDGKHHNQLSTLSSMFWYCLHYHQLSTWSFQNIDLKETRIMLFNISFYKIMYKKKS